MSTDAGYPRDLRGYGEHAPDPKWPGGARVAVQFVLNYEEGGENCVLHGDAAAEAFLSEIPGAQPIVGARHMNMESIYEYGSRVGFWRLLRIFEARGLPLTSFAVASALERYPEAAAAMQARGHEIATHGWKWVDYQHVAEDIERAHIRKAVEVHTRICGERPLGFYQGRMSPNTRRLVLEEGGFLYDADSYADELPYWIPGATPGSHHLVVPYTLDCNDMRFSTVAGFSQGEDFFAYCRDTFDQLYAEGSERPRMMSVGLHCRLVGRPARARALERFLDHIERHDRVWVARRIDIARHWVATHPAA
ncbi:MAG: allantoinase PuuE [Deltaproteobacteria bacterium]|nr:allantoinase PuuE [Deltaproteobacteria bacterium]